MLDAGALTGAALAAVAGLLILWRKARLRAHQARHFAREPKKAARKLALLMSARFGRAGAALAGSFNSSTGSHPSVAASFAMISALR